MATNPLDKQAVITTKIVEVTTKESNVEQFKRILDAIDNCNCGMGMDECRNYSGPHSCKTCPLSSGIRRDILGVECGITQLKTLAHLIHRRMNDSEKF